jgi:aryl-alcohol dehydrogenase-like predicted oxidoreductase
VPIEEVAGAVKELIAEGKARYFGLSEVGAQTLAARPRRPSGRRRAERVFACGRATRKPEVLPACAELGIGFVPWSPLGQGFLTGAVSAGQTFDASDIRSRFPRFTPEAMAANQPLIALLHRLAARETGDTGANRAGLASRAAALHCAHSGDAQAAPAWKRTWAPPISC